MVFGEGFASPDGPVFWNGKYIMAMQRDYPRRDRALPSLAFAYSLDNCESWSTPKPFLPAANTVGWNQVGRVIDPTLVVDSNGLLHCFFIGTINLDTGSEESRRANVLGHAVTEDGNLVDWNIDPQPLKGVSKRAPDGVENVAVFERDGVYTMIYSEGLQSQHLARMTSTNLIHWKDHGRLRLEGVTDFQVPAWMAGRFGAPYVWRDGDRWAMLLMGEEKPVQKHRSTLGLYFSKDGALWTGLSAAMSSS